MLRKLMKTSWTYHLVTKYVWNVSNYNPLSKSDIKYHTMHHYGWSLLNTTPRKNTQRTKHIIQILDHRKCKNLCIVTEHVHTFFIKKTKNKRSSKIIKPKRNSKNSKSLTPSILIFIWNTIRYLKRLLKLFELRRNVSNRLDVLSPKTSWNLIFLYLLKQM